MKLVLKIAAGIFIGLLAFQVGMYFLSDQYRANFAAFEKAERLLGKATTMQTAIRLYYLREGILPTYNSDLDCKAHSDRKCATGQKDAVFYISNSTDWVALKPYLAEGEVNFHCKTTIQKELIYGEPFGASCKKIDKSDIPDFGKPSFDCNKATKVVEKLICKSDRLMELDRRLAKIYNEKRSISSEAVKEVLKSSQIAFIKKRDKECDSSQCIEKLTRNRILKIELYDYDQ